MAKFARRRFWLASVAALFTALAALPTAAAAEPGPTAPSVAYTCITVIAPLTAGQNVSQVLVNTCDASARPRALSAAESKAVAASTLLITLYRDADYGPIGNDVRGSAGTCDAAGYGISRVSGEYSAMGISGGELTSYRMYVNCRRAEYWSYYNYSGTYQAPVYGQNVPNVGPTWNDRIESMKIRY